MAEAAGVVVIALVAFLAICWLWPYRVLRVALWLATQSIYRLHVCGRANVPAHGGALLVCDHVSYLDWLLLLAAHRRFIRMVHIAGRSNQGGVRHLLRWAGVLAVDGSAGPRGLVRALRQARDALARGELVCIVAEGRVLPDGLELPFHRLFQRLARKIQAPIVPVCLDQVFGSLFSVKGGRLTWRWPVTLPFPAYVRFGAPLPPGTPAAEVRQALQLLSARSAFERPAGAGRRIAASCGSPLAGPSAPVSSTARGQSGSATPVPSPLCFVRSNSFGRCWATPRWSASGCRQAWAALSPTSSWPCSAKRRSTSITPPRPKRFSPPCASAACATSSARGGSPSA